MSISPPPTRYTVRKVLENFAVFDAIAKLHCDVKLRQILKRQIVEKFVT